MTDRVITLIDMDCFYCQVEQRLDPERLAGKPAAVVQYNDWKGGGIIAVNYEARALGVGRHIRGDEARSICPEIILVKVPEVRGKADLGRYRDAGKEVIQVLKSFGATVERASVDEAYIDITNMVDEKMSVWGREVEVAGVPNTHVVGHEKDHVEQWLRDASAEERMDDIRLAVGATIVEEMRAAIYDKTQFRCSAGIAHNKMLAKLACGINKPNKQTILPHPEVATLFTTLKVTKLRGLGGKLGATIKDTFEVETVSDLAKIPLPDLKRRFEDKTALWLSEISHGMEHEPVRERDLPKSIGCSKNFPGPKMLDTKEKVEFWFGQLAEEIAERLERDRVTNGRVARGITASVSLDSEDRGHVSRAGPLKTYDAEQIARQALLLIGNLNTATKDPSGIWRPKLKNLSVSVCKFEEENAKGTQLIADMFAAKSDVGKIAEEEKEAAARAEELVSSLKDYDESLLEFLPVKIREQVLKRVERLKNVAATSDETLEEEEEEEEEEEGESFFTSAAATTLIVEKQEQECQVEGDTVTNIENDVELVDCPKCERRVSPFELPEHLDFHLARELQKEISRENRPAPLMVSNSKSGKGKSGKRKNSSQDDNAKESKKQKNITSFFTKR